jgi:lysophospholipase L1-like esterase
MVREIGLGGGIVQFFKVLSAAGARPRVREIVIYVSIVIATLFVCEAILRVIDLRELRDGYGPGYTSVFRYDSELGWLPVAHSTAQFHGSRNIAIRHNSLGLRDVEHVATQAPNVVFLGDSFVWGYDVEVQDRFTERLRKDLQGVRIVNAGIPGYGTDQEYLLLKRIWSATDPDVVVLMFCTNNDRDDNSTNKRYGGYLKPYLERIANGAWRFLGQPVPWSRYVYFSEDPLVRHLWLARAAMTGYVVTRHPKIYVADPTERLLGMVRDLVESRGAKFLVGLQDHEPRIEAFLRAQGISFTIFDGAEIFHRDGNHWTPKGHALVADRLKSLFRATGVPGPASLPTQ